MQKSIQATLCTFLQTFFLGADFFSGEISAQNVFVFLTAVFMCAKMCKKMQKMQKNFFFPSEFIKCVQKFSPKVGNKVHIRNIFRKNLLHFLRKTQGLARSAEIQKFEIWNFIHFMLKMFGLVRVYITRKRNTYGQNALRICESVTSFCKKVILCSFEIRGLPVLNLLKFLKREMQLDGHGRNAKKKFFLFFGVFH